MKRFKRVLVGDVLWWGLMVVVFAGMAIGAAFTPQEWDWVKIVFLVAIPLGVVVVATAAVTSTVFASPDFDVVISFGELKIPSVTATVWANDVEKHAALRSDLMVAIKIFVLEYHDPASAARAVDGLTIEFVPDPIKVWGRWSYEEGKAGLQKGKSIIVHWKGSLGKSAFMHELLHVVDEIVRKGYDPEHADSAFWEQELELNSKLQELGL